MNGRLPLREDRLDLWLTEPQSACGPEFLRSYLRLMAPEEVERYAQFRFERHRHQFLVTRALVRTTLSRYASVAPKEWCFAANSYGWPYVAEPEAYGGRLMFNVSRADGMIACAVAWDREVGVDVEDACRPVDIMRVAETFFSAAEVRDLKTLPASRRRARFFSYWTLKEAYAKARGMGLSISLDAVAFELVPGEPIRVRLDGRLQDDSESWHFWCAMVRDRYPLAVAVRTRRQSTPLLTMRRVIPLGPCAASGRRNT